MNSRLKLILIAAALVIVTPIIIWVWTMTSQSGTTNVKISVLPEDSTVIIDNKDISGKRSIRLKPGEYTFTISKEGFEKDIKKVTLKEGDAEYQLFSTPTPVSGEAQRWIESNTDKYTKLESKAGKVADEQGREFSDKHPITSMLPIQKSIYSIGYRSTSNGDSITLTVYAEEGYREAALQELRDAHFDPSEYEIEFKDYRSPFDE